MNYRNELRRSRAGGFTLIEVLLVVTIIGMLATIAAINIPKFLGQGRESKARADVSSISTAIELYNMNEGRYPAGLSALTEGNDPYMKSIPRDPWGNDYQFRTPGTRRGLRFEVFSMGESGTESTIIGNWEPDKLP